MTPSGSSSVGSADADQATPRVALRRASLLSGVDAGVDVRKMCNAVKRSSSAMSTAMLGLVDAQAAAQAATSLAGSLLEAVGFPLEDAARVESVMPMALEASAAVVSEAARLAASRGQAMDSAALDAAVKHGATMMAELAKNRAIARMVEPSWPADLDATAALRIAVTSALAPLTPHLLEFDYMHSAAECVREAGKTVVHAAIKAADSIAPRQASPASRAVLLQSMIGSAAKLYIAAWTATAKDETARLDALSDKEVDGELKRMECAPLAKLLAPVTQKFQNLLDATVGAASDAFPLSAATLQQSAQPPADSSDTGSVELSPAGRLNRMRSRP